MFSYIYALGQGCGLERVSPLAVGAGYSGNVISLGRTNDGRIVEMAA